MTDEAFETISRLWAAEMAALQGMDRPDLDDARLEACYEKVLVEHPVQSVWTMTATTSTTPGC
jgi:hypothetical protein